MGEGLESFFGSMEGLLAALLAGSVFLSLYIYSAYRLYAEKNGALERIRQSLTLYSQLAGPLTSVIDRKEGPSILDDELIRLLQECKAADRLTVDLLEQIDMFLRDRDHARLPLISKTLEKEMNALVRERSELLRRLESPGWGGGLWMLLKPAVPGTAFAAAVLWTFILADNLRSGGSDAWSSLLPWCLWLSSMTATVSSYRILMDSPRKTPSAVFYLLHLLIIAVALVNLFWAEAPPYVLATQLMLYAAGFSLTTGRSRKDRPYAGSPEMLEEYTRSSESSGYAEGYSAGLARGNSSAKVPVSKKRK